VLLFVYKLHFVNFILINEDDDDDDASGLQSAIAKVRQTLTLTLTLTLTFSMIDFGYSGLTPASVGPRKTANGADIHDGSFREGQVYVGGGCKCPDTAASSAGSTGSRSTRY